MLPRDRCRPAAGNVVCRRDYTVVPGPSLAWASLADSLAASCHESITDVHGGGCVWSIAVSTDLLPQTLSEVKRIAPHAYLHVHTVWMRADRRNEVGESWHVGRYR